MRQNRHSRRMYDMHRNTLLDSFRIRIVWFQPKQDSDRISFFKNRIGSDSENPLSLWFPIPHACLPIFYGIQYQNQTPLKGFFARTNFIVKNFDNEVLRGVCVFYFSLCVWFKTSFKILKRSGFIHWKQGMHCMLCIHWCYAPESESFLQNLWASDGQTEFVCKQRNEHFLL